MEKNGNPPHVSELCQASPPNYKNEIDYQHLPTLFA